MYMGGKTVALNLNGGQRGFIGRIFQLSMFGLSSSQPVFESRSAITHDGGDFPGAHS